MSNQPRPKRQADRADTITMTPSQLVAVYAGPSSTIISPDMPLVPLIHMGGGFSYDPLLKSHRATLQRPVAEQRGRFVDKLKGIGRVYGSLGLGILFNGMPGGQVGCDVRGYWLADCTDLHGHIAWNSGGPIIDVVSLGCAEPVEWTSFPLRLSGDPEF